MFMQLGHNYRRDVRIILAYELITAFYVHRIYTGKESH